MKSSLSILSAMSDSALFGRWFKPGTWNAWIAFLAGLFGLPMTEDQAKLFRKFTGRTSLPIEVTTEAWVIAGRRGGKSLIAAFVAVFLACFRDYRIFLGPGEVATVMIIATDRRQARVIMRYVAGFFEAVPMLKALVANQTKESIELSNRVIIEIHTASFRSTRGYTLAACVCDELAFWRSEESANPDVEILNGLRPGLATIPGALLLCISSPYARRGALWQAYQKHYGKDGDPVLVWQADTRSMNPKVPERIIREAYESDPAAAAAEYGAEFRKDVENFVSFEAVQACIISGRKKLPPAEGIRYFAFVDPSGGSSDSMTLAISHKDEKRIILDAIREVKPPFGPESVVDEFCDLLKFYGISKVHGDRYAGEWPREQFRKHGIEYKVAGKAKSDLYRDLLPLINSASVELLDIPRLTNQLVSLERRTSRGGKDSIDHQPGSHDDLANAVAGVLVEGRATKRPWGVLGMEEEIAKGWTPDDDNRTENGEIFIPIGRPNLGPW